MWLGKNDPFLGGKNSRVKAIRLSTLEAICQALECQPGDVLEYKTELQVVDE